MHAGQGQPEQGISQPGITQQSERAEAQHLPLQSSDLEVQLQQGHARGFADAAHPMHMSQA